MRFTNKGKRNHLDTAMFEYLAHRVEVLSEREQHGDGGMAL